MHCVGGKSVKHEVDDFALVLLFVIVLVGIEPWKVGLSSQVLQLSALGLVLALHWRHSGMLLWLGLDILSALVEMRS